MRVLRVLSVCFSTSLMLFACRSTPEARVESAPLPAQAAAPVEARGEPVIAAQVDPPRVVREEAPVKAPEIAVPPNRDRHAHADVGTYIAQLESATRVAELRVDTVLEKLALPSDAWIGDLGCGPGVFAIAFANAVPDGVVFASDIEPRQLDVLRAKIRTGRLNNVVPVLSSEDDPHFPPAALDVVFIGDTYHHLEDRVAYMKRIVKLLKPGGRLVVLDYKAGKLDVGPPPEHKLKAGQMTKELLDAGWKQVEKFDTHPFHDFEIWRPVQPWEKK